MKICALLTGGEESTEIKDIELLQKVFMCGKEQHSLDIFFLKKLTALKQVSYLSLPKKYDIYLNLCDEIIAKELIEIFTKLNLSYTGASPSFSMISNQAMRMAACGIDVSIPNHVFAYTDFDIELTLKQNMNMPVIIKSPSRQDYARKVEKVKVMSQEQLVLEAKTFVDNVGGALIEEFINGPEFAVLVVANSENYEEPIVFTPAECTFRETLDFTLTAQPLIWTPVTDSILSEQLKATSRKIFVSCYASGYAICNFRIRRNTNEMFFMKITPNCSIFNDKKNLSPADFILTFDPLSFQGFRDAIIGNALLEQHKRRKVVRPFFSPEKGFFSQAIEDIPVGGILHKKEEKSINLVSSKYVENNWGVQKQKELSKYAYPFSMNIFVTWNEDPNEWTPTNHSCDPNAWFEGLNVVARKPIQKGDEITTDYATNAGVDFTGEFQCMCKSANCRKIVRPFDYLDKDFQERYKNHLSEYVLQQISKPD